LSHRDLLNVHWGMRMRSFLATVNGLFEKLLNLASEEVFLA